MKKYMIITLISFAVLCTCNFIFPLIYIIEPQTSIIVTIISGWISGLSTLVVGIVAFLQSKKYNDSNNEFIKKQFELEQAKAIVNARVLFVDNLKKTWKEFVENVNPAVMANAIMVLNNDISGNIIYDKAIKLIVDSTFVVHSNCNNLLNQIELDFLDSEEKDKLKECVSKYKEKYLSFFEDDKNTHKMATDLNALFDFVLKDFGEMFLNLTKLGNKYIVKSDLDINFSINYKINDIKYLKEQYSPIKENPNKTIHNS